MKRKSTFALVALTVALPVAVWGLVGDQSTVDPREASYILHPPRIGRAAEVALGLAASVVVLGSSSVLRAESRAGHFHKAWWSVVTLLAIVAAAIGFGYRIVTAGVGGANIGGGFLIMFGIPVVVSLIVCALIVAAVLHVKAGRAPSLSSPTESRFE